MIQKRGLYAGAAAALAAGLFVHQRVRDAERAHRPAGRFVEVDGVRLHYVERGDGPPLVLLHGVGTMIEDFALSGTLARAGVRYRVIAFDRPGYGHSTRPRGRLWTPHAQAVLLHKALGKLGVDWPVVLGHSWGALVALALGLAYPTDIRSLVLLSGSYYPSARLDMALMAPPAIPVLGDVMRHTVSPLLARWLWPAWTKMLFSPSPVPSYFAAFPVWMALRPSQLRATAEDSALLVPAVTAMRRRYGRLKVPSYILAGAADRYVDARHSARLHRELPHSRLEIAPRAGHMLHHVERDRVIQAIDAAAA
jgi:pimeloyl-ACP methyl ester carboxylesterase